MSQSDRAIKKLATDLARLKREVVSWRGAQADFTSIENGGNFTFKDGDGNVTAIVGGQDDGSNTIRHVDGPTPPIPSGLTAHVDGPIVQVSWDGTFESDVTHDWHYLEVLAVGPSNEQLTGTINDLSGGETSLAAPSQGDWVITARSVSRAGKRSLDGDAGTVAVQLVGLTGAIEAVQESANGKSTIYYSPTEPVAPEGGFNNGDLWFDTSEEGNNRASVWDGAKWLSVADGRVTDIAAAQDVLDANQEALDGRLDDAFGQIEDAIVSANGKNVVHYEADAPTAADPGVEGDTWFVGQVGRPNDVVEATNLITNPSFENGIDGWRARSTYQAEVGASSFSSGVAVGTGCLYITSTANASTDTVAVSDEFPISENASYVFAASVRKSSGSNSGQFRVYWYNSSGARISTSNSETFVISLGQNNLTTTRFEKSFTSPAGAVSAEVGVRLTNVSGGAPETNATAHIDAVYFGSSENEVYFDGDTESGATDNESHYRWTGTPHASTSEKYLPASNTSNWEVLEQYKFTDGVWVQVELNHQVISSMDVGKLVAGSAAIKEAVVQKLFAEVVVSRMSVAEEFIGENAILTGAVTADKMAVGSITAESGIIESLDLGTATVGELDGIRIMARTMSSEVFEGNAFNGYVFTGSIFRTTNGSEFSDNGLFMYDQDGTPRVQAPVDGSDFTINAEIIARSMTAVGRASFLSDNNRLEPGAGLVLAAGVGDPPSPPVVSTYFPTVPAPPIPDGYRCTGIGFTGGHFYRLVDNETANANDLMQKIAPDGTIVDEWEFLYNSQNGMTAIDGELFLFGYEEGKRGEKKRHVRVYSTTGEYKRQWEYTEFGSGTYEPGIGCDEDGSLVTAQCDANGFLRWRTHNKTTGAVTSLLESDDRTSSDIAGIYIGVADFGVKRAVIAKTTGGRGYRQFPAFNTTTGVYVSDQSWHSPGEETPRGIVWDGTKFYSTNTSGRISEYSTIDTGDSSGVSDWWVAYRWVTVDDDQVDRHSRISPPARFAWPRRARLKVSAPNLPMGAEGVAPSLAQKTSTPSRTDFHSPAWWYEEGEPSASYRELPADWETAPAPSDGNNFPNGDPSVLEAASGLFELKGDGSGHWGPLVFNTDGTMSSNAVPDWVPVTTFETGFTPQTWGYAPAYRIWPDGKVEWRGVVAGTIEATGTAYILTIPEAARPAQPVNVTSAVSGEAVARIEFSAAASPSVLAVKGSGAARSWVSLDSIFYYLT